MDTFAGMLATYRNRRVWSGLRSRDYYKGSRTASPVERWFPGFRGVAVELEVA
jgi:hypothetical protein